LKCYKAILKIMILIKFSFEEVKDNGTKCFGVLRITDGSL